MKVWAVVTYSTKRSAVAIEGIFSTRKQAREVLKKHKEHCKDCPAHNCCRIKNKSVTLDKEETVFVIYTLAWIVLILTIVKMRDLLS